jgi:hypothetical protein
MAWPHARMGAKLWDGGIAATASQWRRNAERLQPWLTHNSWALVFWARMANDHRCWQQRALRFFTPHAEVPWLPLERLAPKHPGGQFSFSPWPGVAAWRSRGCAHHSRARSHLGRGPTPAFAVASWANPQALPWHRGDAGCSGPPAQHQLATGKEAEGARTQSRPLPLLPETAAKAGITYGIEPAGPQGNQLLNTLAEGVAMASEIAHSAPKDLWLMAAPRRALKALPICRARRGPGESALAFAPILRALAEQLAAFTATIPTEGG